MPRPYIRHASQIPPEFLQISLLGLRQAATIIVNELNSVLTAMNADYRWALVQQQPAPADSETQTETIPRRPTMSAAGRRAISIAQKRRWAAVRKAK